MYTYIARDREHQAIRSRLCLLFKAIVNVGSFAVQSGRSDCKADVKNCNPRRNWTTPIATKTAAFMQRRQKCVRTFTSLR